MKWGGDLQKPGLIHLKGWLFLGIGLMAGGLLWWQNPGWTTAGLLVAMGWGFCRFYYYLFYVLERYLGRKRPYAGVWDALRALWRREG